MVKVVCFDTLLQVLILKDLECTKIVQGEGCRTVGRLEGKKVERVGRSSEGGKPERESRDPSWSATFKR